MRAVRVHKLPKAMNCSEAKTFLRELSNACESGRPRFVLDCSGWQTVDAKSMTILLSCLEIVMMSNGDLRLCGLSHKAELVLQNAGIWRIFETFPSVESATESFHRRASSLAPHTVGQDAADHELEEMAA